MQHTEGTAMTKCRSKTKGVKVKVTEHLKTKRMEYIAGHSAQDKSVKMKGKTLHIIRPCHKLPYIQKNSNRAHQSQNLRLGEPKEDRNHDDRRIWRGYY